jgi:hypothetical protein
VVAIHRKTHERPAMTTEILINIAVVFVSMVGVIVLGLWILNGMMDDESPIESAEARYVDRNTPKPPPEPEH